ncbi:MAG: hypothetical protein NTU80_03595 [Verrucomicrobia bacterium]|nr:hypothetical protein [Verrucomicrobiota bacterium]
MRLASEGPHLPDSKSAPSASARALRIVGEVARPLSKMQIKFNKLVARIERLRAEQQHTVKRWDSALIDYAERIHPLEKITDGKRVELLRALRELWLEPKAVSKKQRATMRDFCMLQIRRLSQGLPGDAQDLAGWENELKVDALKQITDEAKALQENPEAQEELRQAGIDFSKLRPDMTPDEQFAEMMRQMADSNERHKLFSEDEFADGDSSEQERPPQSKKATAAQTRAARREAELEEARKRGIATIYKQLAKVLHPDLEQNPERRAQKENLMQELTVAYRAGDLHTLLRLELEFIHREQGDLMRLGEDKLKIYCELLTEQAWELEAESGQVHHQPRYVALRPFVNPFFGELPRWREVESGLREEAMQLAGTILDLSGPHGKQRLTELLRVFKNQQRRQSPLNDLF